MIAFCPRCATPVEQRLIENTPRPVCPACGYVHFADPKVAAAVLIVRDARLLLVQRAVEPRRGLWCFPGGYVDYGEDPRTAAIRECREEAALVIDRLELLDVAFGGNVIVITYLAQANANASPRPADDAAAVAWFSPDDLPPLAFASNLHAIERWQNRRNER
jgi:8-oxo-dGTP diphosphatase